MDSSESKPSLLDLHDYCLQHICTFLPLMDKANLGRTCSRLKNIINYLISRIHVDSQYIHETQSYEKARDFFVNYGPYIKYIFVDHPATKGTDEFLSLIPNNCPNIEKVHFQFLYFVGVTIMKQMFESCPNIKSLVCRTRRELRDEECLLICKLSKLEVLNVSKNPDLTGLHLPKFKTLKELNLEECESVKSEYFIEMCYRNKLKKLNIVQCDLLDDEAFEVLVETQTELEEISVNYGYPDGDVSVISSLKKLHSIYIDFRWTYDQEDRKIIRALPQDRCHLLRVFEMKNPRNLLPAEREKILKLINLEKLSITYNEYIDDEFLLQISKNCSKLQEVNLPKCSKITNLGYIHLVTNLKNLKVLHLPDSRQICAELYEKLFEIKNKQVDAKKLTILPILFGRKKDLKNIEMYHKKKKIVELVYWR